MPFSNKRRRQDEILLKIMSNKIGMFYFMKIVSHAIWFSWLPKLSDASNPKYQKSKTESCPKMIWGQFQGFGRWKVGWTKIQNDVPNFSRFRMIGRYFINSFRRQYHVLTIHYSKTVKIYHFKQFSSALVLSSTFEHSNLKNVW